MPKIRPSKLGIKLIQAVGSRRRLVVSGIGIGLVAMLAAVSLTVILTEPDQRTGVNRVNPNSQKPNRVDSRIKTGVDEPIQVNPEVEEPIQVSPDAGRPAEIVFRQVTDAAIGASDLGVCRVPQSYDSNRWWGDLIGFTENRSTPLPSTGTARIAIVGLDFFDAPGEGRPSDLRFDGAPSNWHLEIEPYLNRWSERHTHGKLRWQVDFVDVWLRAPKSYTEYNHVGEGSPGAEPLRRTREELSTELLTVASTVLDLPNINALMVLYPEQLHDKQVGIYNPTNQPLPTPQGNVTIPIFGTTSFSNPIPSTYNYFMTHVLHEMQHFQGIPLHAPGNGSVFFHPPGDYRAHSVTSWEAFVLGWKNEQQIHCFEGRGQLDVTFDLSVIDVHPGNKSSAMIRISENQIIVLEARAGMSYNALPPGSLGLTAYLVNTSVSNRQRCDSCTDLETELAQWAYFLRADGAKRGVHFVPWVSPTDMNILIQAGERAVHRGFIIENLSSDGTTRVRVTNKG
jgi:hypothetical protein